MRLRRAVMWTAASLVGIELAMQVGHAVLGETAETSAVPLVLCLGDRWMAGAGATSMERAVPVRLAAALHDATGDRWLAIDAAAYGRTSFDAAREAARLLERHRPHVVCVQIGAEDRWRRPLRQAPMPTSTPKLRLRTVELVARLTDAEPAAPPAADAHPPLAGTAWATPELVLFFGHDGSLSSLDFRTRWRREGASLIVAVPPQELVFRWSSTADRLVLHHDDWPQPVSLRSVDLPSAGIRARAAELLAAGNPRSALRALDKTRMRQVATADLLLRVRAHAALADWRQARLVAARLHERWNAATTAIAAVDEGFAWCEALLATGEPAAALDAVAKIAATGHTARSLAMRGRLRLRIGESRGAAEDLDAALARSDAPLAGEARILALVARAELSAQLARGAALGDAVAAIAAGAPDGEIRRVLDSLAPAARTPAAVARALEGGNANARVRERAMRLIAEVAARHEGAREALLHNLRVIVATCRAAGARVVLLGYPHAPEHVRRTRLVAALLERAWRCEPAEVLARLAAPERDRLVHDDGRRLTDAGQARVAAALAARIVEMRRASR